MLRCFLVKVLTRLYPTIDLTNLQADMVCLRVDIDTILDIRVSEPKAAPADLVEDTVLVALFTTTTAPPPLHVSVSRGTDPETVRITRLGRSIVLRWSLREEIHCLMRKPDR